MEILPDFEDWATDGGPLTISSDGGNTSLALFRKNGEQHDERRGTIAFRVGGAGFLEFLTRLEKIELLDENGGRVTAGDVVDHDKSFSIYFCDADKDLFELTTYDYETVRGQSLKP